MYICVIIRQEQKIQVPCKRNDMPDTFKGLRANNSLVKSNNI